MLLCKACNTRFQPGRSACPSCGRKSFTRITESARDAGAHGALPLPTPPPADAGNEASDTDVDLELHEVDVLAAAVDPEAAEELKPEVPTKTPRHSLLREPGPAVLHLSSPQVRTLVAEQPTLLEPQLAIYADEQGHQVGVDFPTPVGSIDLLARAPDGSFVIVMVPEPRDTDTLVPEILARIGYVRKHVAASRKPVRGIVVIDEIPEELAYAAAGVSQTVAFKTYRVALTFHDLDL